MKFLLLIFLTIAGCASEPLSKEEQSIRILRKSDPPATCKELGKVHAPGFGSITDEGREQDLRRAAYALGADTVTWDKQDENETVFGTAFKCH